MAVVLSLYTYLTQNILIQCPIYIHYIEMPHVFISQCIVLFFGYNLSLFRCVLDGIYAAALENKMSARLLMHSITVWHYIYIILYSMLNTSWFYFLLLFIMHCIENIFLYFNVFRYF